MATGGININANLTLNPQSITAASKQVQQALGRITGQASEFQKSLDASTARVFAFGATTSILNGVGQAFKTLVANTIEVEKRITEIGSILGGTTSQLNALRSTIFSVAKDTGQAFSTTADAAAELARQGLSAEETAKRLSAALILTRVSGLDSVKSVKALTSAINGFTSAGLTAEQITNKLVAVDTKFAVSAQDLAEGFSRAGSTAEDAGVSFDELLGIITAVEQKTARGGAVIGNALKSIFARLGRSTTIEDLKELGVEIDSSQTGIQKLQSLSAALEKVADPTVASKIKELAGGVFQINVVSAALKDLGSDTSIFAKAALTASSATNEAFTKNAALNTTISSQINSLVIGLTDLSSKIGDITFGPIAKNLLSLANTFTDFLQKAFDPEKGNQFIQGLFKGIGSFLAGPGLVIITTAFLKIFTLVAKFAKEGFKTILEIGSQTEKIRGIEGGIVGLLSRDQQLRAVIASTTATQAQKEAAVISAIQKENSLLTQQEQLLRSIATAASQRGIGGYSPTGGFSGKKGQRFATGYMQEEATAKMLGASPSVRAKQGKGTIGGRSFIMNNQETEIPNFGRNGDSAIIPHYANGFIPNYAKSRKTNNPVAMAKATARMESRGKETTPIQRYNIDPSGYAFLAPSASSITGLTKNLIGNASVAGKKYPFSLTKAVSGFSAKLSSSSINKSAEPYDSKIEENITRNIGDAAFAYAKLLDPPSSNKSTKEDVFNRITTQRGGKGAIRSAVGTAFEAAVTSALSIQEAALGKGGDFDAPYINDEVAQLFGITGKYKKGDFKVSGSKGNVESFIGKIIKENPSLVKPQGKAAGFIPNFNSVNKGIPVSQIRAHFDKSGSPIAVTNTRDEPNGLKDAIGRERQGIGMAAKGFIPNYAKAKQPLPLLPLLPPIPNIAPQIQAVANSAVEGKKAFDKFGAGSLAASFALSLVPQLIPEIKDTDNALASTAKSISSSTVQFASVGAAFGPWGIAIGAALGVTKAIYDSFKDVADKEKELAETTKKTNDQLKGSKAVENLTSSALNLGNAFDEAGNRVLDSKSVSSAYNNIIKAYKTEGQSTDEITNAKKKAADVLSNSAYSQEQKDEASEKYSNILNSAIASLAKKMFEKANEIESKIQFDKLNISISKFSEVLERQAVKLDQQKFAEGIASNVTTKTNAPYAEATKAAIAIQQSKTLASESKVGFMKNFAGTDFSNMLNDVRKTQMVGKSGAEVSGAISKDVFSAYMKDGAIGAGKALDSYLKGSLDPEDAKKFKDNVITSASTFRQNVADTMQKALNRETEVQNNLSELTEKIKEAGTTFMAEASSKIQELLSGPKLDPLALANKFKEASKLLGSTKKGDIEKGRNILASTAGDQKTFETRFGRDKLIELQKSQGLTTQKTGIALGSAAIESSDLSGIKNAIIKNLTGGSRITTLEALKTAEQDPTKVTALIDIIKQKFGQLNLKGRQEGKVVVDTLSPLKDVTKDPAMAGLDAQKEALNAELGTLKTKISELNTLFGDTGIPQAVTSLTNSVNAAATNLKGFQDFTANLNSLSDTVNGKLIDINNRLTILSK